MTQMGAPSCLPAELSTFDALVFFGHSRAQSYCTKKKHALRGNGLRKASVSWNLWMHLDEWDDADQQLSHAFAMSVAYIWILWIHLVHDNHPKSKCRKSWKIGHIGHPTAPTLRRPSARSLGSNKDGTLTSTTFLGKKNESTLQPKKKEDSLIFSEFTRNVVSTCFNPSSINII